MNRCPAVWDSMRLYGARASAKRLEQVAEGFIGNRKSPRLKNVTAGH